MSLRDSILAAKPAQKTVVLKTLQAPGGKPLRVTVRGLSTSEDIEISRLCAGQDDPFQRGLLVLTCVICDPKTGEPIFTREDVAGLEKLKASVVSELFALYGEVRAEVEQQAKK